MSFPVRHAVASGELGFEAFRDVVQARFAHVPVLLPVLRADPKVAVSRVKPYPAHEVVYFFKQMLFELGHNCETGICR